MRPSRPPPIMMTLFWSAPAERSGDGALVSVITNSGGVFSVSNPKRRRRFALLPHSKLLVFQNHHRRVATARAHDAAARMRRRAAHVQVPNRRAVLRPSRRGT